MNKILLIIAIVFCFGLSAYAQKDIEATTEDGKVVILKADGTWEWKPEPKIKPLGVTMAGFAAVKDEMSYEKVVAILGREGELISESTIGDISTKMYSWKAGKGSGFGASMSAMFQQNKLMSKSQFGLK